MIRVITKNKEELKIYNYHKYQVFDSSNTEESFKATYHLYLNKKDALKFFVNDVVEVAFMGNGWVVRSVSHLDGDTFCVELTQEYESTKKEELETKDETTKLESKTLESKIPESKTSCSDCDETKEEAKKYITGEKEHYFEEDSKKEAPAEKEHKLDLPNSHCIVIFADDEQYTVAAEYDDGEVIRVETAKCHKDDKFDFLKGAKLAFNRLVDGVDDINEHCDCKCGCECECDSADEFEQETIEHCGEPTDFKDFYGNTVKVGDVVTLHIDNATYTGILAKNDDGDEHSVDYKLVTKEGSWIAGLDGTEQLDIIWRP